jgi:hypothetical protein
LLTIVVDELSLFLLEVVGCGCGKGREEEEEKANPVSDMSDMSESDIIMMITMTTFIIDRNTIC